MRLTTLSSADLVDVIDPKGPGSVIVNPSLPDHISKNPNNGDLVIWEEAQNLILDADLFVDKIFSASPFVFSEEGKHYISTGALVSNHLIQWDPPKNSSAKRVEAQLVFSAPIMGLIESRPSLKISDSILGNDWMSFDDFNLRGLEGADETIIQNDAAFISWRASSPGD